MQQRVLIAMALAHAQPSLLILDEPTTNLDVTTEAAILDLVRDLATDAPDGHALRLAQPGRGGRPSVTGWRCSTPASWWRTCHTDALRSQPLHPYTLGLLDSVPRLGQRHRHRSAGMPIPGRHAALDAAAGAGCVFAPRCSDCAATLCYDQRPELEATPDGGMVRCHRWREIAAGRPVSPRAARPAAACSERWPKLCRPGDQRW